MYIYKGKYCTGKYYTVTVTNNFPMIIESAYKTFKNGK